MSILFPVVFIHPDMSIRGRPIKFKINLPTAGAPICSFFYKKKEGAYKNLRFCAGGTRAGVTLSKILRGFAPPPRVAPSILRARVRAAL